MFPYFGVYGFANFMYSEYVRRYVTKYYSSGDRMISQTPNLLSTPSQGKKTSRCSCFRDLSAYEVFDVNSEGHCLTHLTQ